MPELQWYLAFAWGRAPYALDLPEVVIGRGEGCPLQIEEAAAAEEHAKFEVDDANQVFIEDLRSGKPTLVNGRPVTTRTALKDGDFIQIGTSVLTLRSKAPADEAKTVVGAELPDEVKRVLAARDAKNFVVGEDTAQAPQQPLQTLMMESPLQKPAREIQRTIESSAEELLAAVRRNQNQPAPTVQMSAVAEPPRTVQMAAVSEPAQNKLPTPAPQPKLPTPAPQPKLDSQRMRAPDPQQTEQPTLIAPAPQRPTPAPMPAPPRPTSPPRAKSTLMGVGPTGVSTSAPTMMADSTPTPTKTPIVAKVSPDVVTSPVAKHDVIEDDPAAALPGEEDEDDALAAQPTMVANMSSQRSIPVEPPPPQRNSQPDITPLPAPLPPGSSIPDLGPYVASAMSGKDGAPPPESSAAIGSASTMALSAQDVALHQAKTQMPMEAPLHQQKTQAPMEAPLHQAKTQMPMEAPRVESQRPRNFAPPTERVKPIDAKAPVSMSRPIEAYTPPTKGPFGAFSRALDFFQQMFQLTKAQPLLLKPLYYDLGISTAFSIVLSALLFVMPGRLSSLVMLLGLIGLYFIDYFCNALTASLVYDYANAGTLDLEAAKARVKKSLPGIATFAAISGILDMATTYARERNDIVAKIVLGIIRSIWTTATYWIMPAMVLEGISFKDAFHRSKTLMEKDPTGVGAGIVALSLSSYIIGFVTFVLAGFLEGLLAHIHPAIGVLFFFLCINAYWAITGWIKISYSTCFYIWAHRCEAAGRPDTELAPNPLRHAIAAG